MVYDKMESAAHHLILEGRERLSVSGVEDVESFDETAAVMRTVRGLLVVRGQGLHVGRLNLEAGELELEGAVESLAYEREPGEQGTLFRRLFR
ncbi:MAG: sporulation protein [Oscillospiraceae bacterium]|nr:sporulation protein [Oscillospiraceae bacterium]